MGKRVKFWLAMLDVVLTSRSHRLEAEALREEVAQLRTELIEARRVTRVMRSMYWQRVLS